jgi:soluble cytochrome b562
LINEVRLYRLRVAAAESKLKILREQARQAKRRRKEAKRLAESARKQFKQFKAGVAELTEALAKAEARLFQAGGRALSREIGKAGRVRKKNVRSGTTVKFAARKPVAAKL